MRRKYGMPDGYKVIDPESLLLEWSKDYGKKEITSYACYSLDNISVIEERLKKLKIDTGIDSFLTGLSGGVRYNKVHVYIAPEDIQEAIRYLDMKEVNSGSNVVIFSLENDSYIKDCRVIDDLAVVSPLQIYLDCMQIKGRGKAKDADDIYFIIKHYIGGVRELAKEFEPVRDKNIVIEAKDKLAGKFASENHAGPKDVADFMDLEDEESIEMTKWDAYKQVQALLNLI